MHPPQNLHPRPPADQRRPPTLATSAPSSHPPIALSSTLKTAKLSQNNVRGTPLNSRLHCRIPRFTELLSVIEPAKPRFQLTPGEEGLSVFDAQAVNPEDVRPHFRPGSQVTTQEIQMIESHGLKVVKTPGDPSLPPILRDNHLEIRPGEGMTRNQFKAALKALEKAAGG